MSGLDRRKFLAAAAAFGASPVWAAPVGRRGSRTRGERRDLYPEGVSSGDPDDHSVILWTRRPFPAEVGAAKLRVEVAEDAEFQAVVAKVNARVELGSDWTCRVLVGGLKPAREYWYRFIDSKGFSSRVGRTMTAPHPHDPRPVRFAFASCQNANQGAQNAFRRMIWEDERSAPADQLGFVLHLGDFIYELVWYPEDRPKGMYDRRLRDIVRYANGERVDDFHIPTTTDDYRAVYRAYLQDPDIQDARARFPFVAMWDNHEFSWSGWQSLQEFNGELRPAQNRKVAANQAWFEYQPARVSKSSGPSLSRFDPPAVRDVPITRFDEQGLGQEPNNLAAIESLTGYRALRWGANVDLIITDQHSYRSREPLGRKEAAAFSSHDWLDLIPEEAMRILDAGREANDGNPPATIRYGDDEVSNFARNDPPQAVLGAAQKEWFLNRLGASNATWKIWGNSLGTLDWRADPQNLPSGLTRPWPGAGYAGFGGGDHSSAHVERAEIYDFVSKRGITGFATIAGDRHSFWAGLSAKALPPAKFEPVGVAFVVGSISAPGLVEAREYGKKDHPLRPLYLIDRSDLPKPEPSINLLLRHGVKSCLEYAASRDLTKARALSNPELSPHLSFVDIAGHGYAVVKAARDKLDVEFVCIPRPLERAATSDGGPIRYRVVHSARLWTSGARPRLEQKLIEGDPGLAI
jgi:alkaline phosphatase D